VEFAKRVECVVLWHSGGDRLGGGTNLRANAIHAHPRGVGRDAHAAHATQNMSGCGLRLNPEHRGARSGRRRGKRLAAVRRREWFRLVEVFRDFKTQGMGQNCAKTRKLLFGLFLCPSVDCEAPPPVLPAAGTRITCTASGARPRLRPRGYYCVREPKPRLLTRGPRWGRAVTELNAAAVL
jgi:hypothetical protein